MGWISRHSSSTSQVMSVPRVPLSTKMIRFIEALNGNFISLHLVAGPVTMSLNFGNATTILVADVRVALNSLSIVVRSLPLLSYTYAKVRVLPMSLEDLAGCPVDELKLPWSLWELQMARPDHTLPIKYKETTIFPDNPRTSASISTNDYFYTYFSLTLGYVFSPQHNMMELQATPRTTYTIEFVYHLTPRPLFLLPQ